MSEREAQIGVCGAAAAEGELYDKAYRVGRLIAARGWTVVCGGLGGVMEAASKGASEVGGVVIGVVPAYEKSSANPYVTYTIATGMGHARNVIIAASADAVIAVGGGYGTLSELALATKLGRPVVALDAPVDIPGVVTAASPEDAVAFAAEALGANR
ncbi:MAG: TIGR00725 family protein [Candidatus Coatesbacteria bacterium]|nr:MAG: TIGR00725 family protein [Candidatus Coatesbacteria bacterium]